MARVDGGLTRRWRRARAPSSVPAATSTGSCSGFARTAFAPLTGTCVYPVMRSSVTVTFSLVLVLVWKLTAPVEPVTSEDGVAVGPDACTR